MTIFAVAYLLVWGVVALYVLRLGMRQRELEDRLNQLSRGNTEIEMPSEAASRAA